MHTYYVYIMTNRSGTLYIGLTYDIVKRVYQHKHKLVESFTSKYKIDRLIYYEEVPSLEDARARERQLKGWLRAKKIALISGMNPTWEDLSAGWYEEKNGDKQ